jgi:hypothetical protein
MIWFLQLVSHITNHKSISEHQHIETIPILEVKSFKNHPLLKIQVVHVI